MKNFSFLVAIVAISVLNSCTDSSLPYQDMQDVVIESRSCSVDQAYLSGLVTFLAGHYQVSESNVSLTYSGVNGSGLHIFPFTVATGTEDINGNYEVDDLCLSYSSDFIVEEDLVGF